MAQPIVPSTRAVMSQRSAIVKLDVKTKADANDTAACVRAEGVDAVIEPPELLELPGAGGSVEKGWAVRVEGPPDAVLAFASRMKENLHH